MRGAHRGQKRASDPVEQKLQMAVNYRWLLGKEFRSSVEIASALNPEPSLILKKLCLSHKNMPVLYYFVKQNVEVSLELS